MQTPAGRTGTRFFFDTKTEAETKADQLRIKRTNEGKSGLSIPERLRIEAMECAAELAAVGATLTDAKVFYLKHAKPSGGNRTCTKATAELLAEKRRTGKRESYVKALGWSLGKFNLTFGEQLLTEVTRLAVEEWFRNLNLKPATEAGYIRDVNILFNFGVDRGYCALNPAAKVEKPMSEDDAPEIFTVQQATHLLKAAEDLAELDMVATLAIGLFAGLRTSELEQLDWAEIDVTAKVIEVTGRKSKTRQRRLVDISANLRKWLLPFRKASGRVMPSGFRGRLEQLREKAKLKEWPKNGMRHSFVSYHMAKHQNANMTALQAGHDVAISFSNYRNLVKPKDAARYWNILPTAKAGSKIIQFEASQPAPAQAVGA